MIHALRYTEDLEKAGFTPEQAKRTVIIWMELMDQNFATRSDFREQSLKSEMAFASIQSSLRKEITDVRSELKQEITDVRSELKQDIAELRSELKQDIAELRSEFKQDISEVKQDIAELRLEVRKIGPDLTIRLGVMMVASIGVISTIIGLIK